MGSALYIVEDHPFGLKVTLRSRLVMHSFPVKSHKAKF